MKKINTIEAYEEYLDENPNTNRKQEILLKVQNLKFQQAVSKNDLETLEKYLKNYPSSVWSDSALSLVRNLKFEKIKPYLEEHKRNIEETTLYPLELKFEYFANLSSYLAINAFDKKWAGKAIENSNDKSMKEISNLLISHNEFFLKTYNELMENQISMKNKFDSLNVLFGFERKNMGWKTLREKELRTTLEMFFCQSDTCFERAKGYLFKDELDIKKLLK